MTEPQETHTWEPCSTGVSVDVADVYLTVFTSRFQEAGRDIVIVGKAIGGLFSVVGQQIARIVPVIRTFAAPLTAIANSFLFDAIRKSFDDFYDSMFRLVLKTI